MVSRFKSRPSLLAVLSSSRIRIYGLPPSRASLAEGRSRLQTCQPEALNSGAETFPEHLDPSNARVQPVSVMVLSCSLRRCHCSLLRYGGEFVHILEKTARQCSTSVQMSSLKHCLAESSLMDLSCPASRLSPYFFAKSSAPPN